MTINKKWLTEHCNQMRYCITDEQERYILSMFKEEPDKNYCWSEQDIHEQIRKILEHSNISFQSDMAVEHE